MQVSRAAKTLPNPPERTLKLHKEKEHAPGFLLPRDPEWDISGQALKAPPSEHCDALSTPVRRNTSEKLQMNPNAYKVKELAKQGFASSRVCELAEPITRGE